MRVGLAILLTFCGHAVCASGQPVDLPSGSSALLQEVISERTGDGLVYRFRFVSEEFQIHDDNLEQIQNDLAVLCETYALEQVPNIGPQPSRIVISMADQPSEYGVFDPDVVQVFEAYSTENETFIWEMF